MKKTSGSVQDYVELGQFYLLNQKYSEAIKQFKLALKLKADTQVYFNLALAYEASCQIPEAKEMYRKAIELNPNHKEATEHLNRLTNQ
jgi:tetratricopeptide (TPR) repeat protein